MLFPTPMTLLDYSHESYANHGVSFYASGPKVTREMQAAQAYTRYKKALLVQVISNHRQLILRDSRR